jgi:ubiquinone/menaquinone biosynthesis C-methylase UbiE
MREPLTASQSPKSYLPAAGHDAFLPLYDVMTALLGADGARRALLDLAPLRAGHRVLDIGCGTGSFVALLKRRYPEVEVVGLDPDPKALARARRKAERAHVSVRFDQGFSDELEYPTASFDLVFSSFMFHHLQGDTKQKTLRETRRVLKPGGRLCLLDFEEPHSHRLPSLLHFQGRLGENTESNILALMTQAGFAHPKKIGGRAVLFGFGHAGYYEASVLA